MKKENKSFKFITKVHGFVEYASPYNKVQCKAYQRFNERNMTIKICILLSGKNFNLKGKQFYNCCFVFSVLNINSAEKSRYDLMESVVLFLCHKLF